MAWRQTWVQPYQKGWAISSYFLEIANCKLQLFTGVYGVFAGFPCCGETLYYLQIVGKSYNYHGVSPQSVNITGFIHNIHRVSLWFLQPFSIDSAGFPCRDPIIPSPHSFHGVKICSVLIKTCFQLGNQVFLVVYKWDVFLNKIFFSSLNFTISKV